LKIQATPGQYLHFCGLKVWALYGEANQYVDAQEEIPDEVEDAKTTSGQFIEVTTVPFN
jgi:hypothetical protein